MYHIHGLICGDTVVKQKCLSNLLRFPLCYCCMSPREENNLLVPRAWLAQVHRNSSVSLGLPSIVTVCAGVCEIRGDMEVMNYM